MAQYNQRTSKPQSASRTQQQQSQTPKHQRAVAGETSVQSPRTQVQQMIANRKIQAKMEVGSAHSPAEAEADQVASEIVGQNHGLTAIATPVQPAAIGTSPTAAKITARSYGPISKSGTLAKWGTAPARTETEVPQPKLQREEDEVEREAAEEETQRVESEEIAAPVLQREEEEVEREATEEETQRVESEEIAAPVLQREEEEVEREASPPEDHKQGFTAPDSVAERINAQRGLGQPLPPDVQADMESGLGVDLSSVRIHTDNEADQLSQAIAARAFTIGADVFFAKGEFNPYTQEGRFLLAHELTHTIQQGALTGRIARMAGEGDELVQASFREVLDDLIWLADQVGIDIPRIADNIPGYTLFSYIIEYDLLRGTNVERNGHNLIRGLMGLVPFGNLAYEKLDEYGLIDDAFNWVEGEMSRLNLSLGRLQDTLSNAWDEMGITEGISGNLAILSRHFQPLLDDVETFAESAADELLEIVKTGLFTPLVGFLEENSPAYVLATKVIGSKFPLEDPVEATTVEILEDFLILIGKETEVEEMKEKGTLQETADWIDTQLERFYGLLGRFSAIVTRVWSLFSLETLQDIPGVFQGIWDDFTELLQDFLDFALDVALMVLELIKNFLLDWLEGFAGEIPGYHLLTVILERDPFTDEPVERSTYNLIRGFMGLVPGGEAKFQELEQTGVVTKAADRIDALVEELGISLDMIVGLFMGIWDSLSIEDLIDPIGAFQRIMDEFGEPIGRLFTFVKKVVIILIELILEIMNFPLDLIQQIIANSMAAFETIKRDPVQFLINLLDAVKLGFQQFFENFLSHLMGGMQAWLFGQLGEAGLTIPQDISFQSILGMSMEVLGISVDNILERLALKIGQERVDQIRGVIDTLTGLWTFIRDVMERGPIAIWEYIQEKISDLWNMVVSAVQNWVTTRIIEAVVTKLLSMLDPTGIMAVVNSFIAFYRAVQSFMEKLREMLEIVNTFVLGVLDIAKGNIQTAADFLEQALADGIPVAIGFLANQVGLGQLGQKIGEMIEAARAKINEGIDWLIDKALEAGTAFMSMLGLGGEEESEEETPANPDDLDIEETEEFSMHGAGHTLTADYENDQLKVIMASPNPNELAAKIGEQIRTMEGSLARGASDPPELRALRTLKTNVETSISDAQTEIDGVVTSLQGTAQAGDIGARVREVEDRLLLTLKRLIVNAVEPYPGIRDFAYQAFNLQQHVDPIVTNLNGELEKHIANSNATGDGHAASAYAAEAHLGWFARPRDPSKLNDRPQLHKIKVQTGQRILETNYQALDSFVDQGYEYLRDEPTYRNNKGETKPVYTSAWENIERCDLALTNPGGYLSQYGVLDEFRYEVAQRLANDGPQVANTFALHGMQLGDPSTVPH